MSKWFTPAEGFATGFVFGLLLCLTLANTGCHRAKDNTGEAANRAHVESMRLLARSVECYPNTATGCTNGQDGFTCTATNPPPGFRGYTFCDVNGACQLLTAPALESP